MPKCDRINGGDEKEESRRDLLPIFPGREHYPGGGGRVDFRRDGRLLRSR